MKFTKVLSAFLLLLMSSNCFSFTSEELSGSFSIEQQATTFDLEEGADFSYDSNISVQINLNKVQYVVFNNRNFSFLSSHRERIAREYFHFSHLIDPNLGIAEIIFPFHSFL